MIGKTISHYRVTAKLGAGGMGEVYRAHDERLERDVALKVLPAETLADEVARKRFRKEALALSKLNHPNIATIYDFDTQDGVDFLVMEYVEGTTLSEKLSGHSLPEKDVAKLGEQVADALEEAHERGVIHRDLKPSNVMVTPKGQAKVLDFGLAKLVRPVSETAVTESLTELPGVAGTFPYMSPEQLRAEPVDGRTDIYALGALLYQMATGQRPFPEAQTPQLIAAILHRTPQAPSELNQQVSAGLESIILKALEKNPEQRYQSSRELRVDLDRLSGPVPFVVAPRRRESIAVLPLENLSGDPEQDYFADGITEALITDLGKIGALRVISRRSVMRYRRSDKPLPEIARELNVDVVVEGSAVRSGDRVRITAQLISAATEEHLWADRYERELRDVLSLQNEIVVAIAREIELQLTPQEQTRLASARPVNPEAYEAYLKGRFQWYKLSSQHLDTALEYFQLALEKDPNYALAYAGTAYTWFSRADCGVVPPREAFPKAKAAALKAIELDDTLAEVHEILAFVRISEWDWGRGEAEFQRAIQLNPNYADARFFYSDFLISMRRPEEWKAEIERALELDPFNFFFQCFFGWHLVYLRRYDEAIAQLRKTLRTEPNFPAAHLGLWGAFYQKHMYEDALAEAKKFFGLLGDSEGVEALACGYVEAGYPGAMSLAAKKLAARSNLTHVPAFRIARLYAHAGEKDRSLEWLEKAYEERETPLAHLSVGWDWDRLRDDPRFQDLLRRIGLPS